MNTPKPVRLQEIADQAGVSRATVSLALRNHATIPLKTRARIHKVAQQLGYRPNPLVSALMMHRRTSQELQPTHLSLALLLDFSRHDSWQSYVSPDLLAAAAARAAQQGYQLEEFWLRDQRISGRRLSEVLYRRNIPGVIIAPLPAARGHLRLEWKNHAAVAIGHSLLRPQLHRVTTDRFKAALMAVRQLRRMGYERIGLAMPENQDARVDHQWGAAIVWEQQQSRASRQVTPFIVEDRRWNARSFARWFEAQRPEVILGYDVAIVGWLQQLGQRVPEDVGFVHLWTPDLSGKYAGLFHNPPAIGSAAVDFVVGMIQRNERGLPAAPQTLLLEARWQSGATLQRRNGARPAAAGKRPFST